MDGLKNLRVEKSQAKTLQAFQQATKPKNKKKFFNLKKILLGCLLIIIIGLGWLTYTGFKTFKAISEGDNNIFKIFGKEQTELKSTDGRTNILILGNGGENHPGGNLTDTIMIASIDNQNKKLALISIPRDLYVTIPSHGKNKINSAFSLGLSNKKNLNEGIDLIEKTISQTFDIEMHYYFKGDFLALTKIVDSVGGITIDVPEAINDPYYPDEKMIGYAPFKLSAGKQTLDGKTALKYARTRKTTSDFDRSRRQQEILLALKEKIISAQTLSNPKKLTEITGALQDHIRTNLGINEIKYLYTLSSNFTSSNVITKVFDTSPTGGLISDNGTSNLVPRTGNFNAMSEQVKNIFQAIPNAGTVEIKNATGKKNGADTLEDLLTSYGFTISKNKQISTAKTSSISAKSSDEKSNSLTLVKNSINIASVTTDEKISTDFVITVGTDYVPKKILY